MNQGEPIRILPTVEEMQMEPIRDELLEEIDALLAACNLAKLEEILDQLYNLDTKKPSEPEQVS